MAKESGVSLTGFYNPVEEAYLEELVRTSNSISWLSAGCFPASYESRILGGFSLESGPEVMLTLVGHPPPFAHPTTFEVNLLSPCCNTLINGIPYACKACSGSLDREAFNNPNLTNCTSSDAVRDTLLDWFQQHKMNVLTSALTVTEILDVGYSFERILNDILSSDTA